MKKLNLLNNQWNYFADSISNCKSSSFIVFVGKKLIHQQ